MAEPLFSSLDSIAALSPVGTDQSARLSTAGLAAERSVLRQPAPHSAKRCGCPRDRGRCTQLLCPRLTRRYCLLFAVGTPSPLAAASARTGAQRAAFRRQGLANDCALAGRASGRVDAPSSSTANAPLRLAAMALFLFMGFLMFCAVSMPVGRSAGHASGSGTSARRRSRSVAARCGQGHWSSRVLTPPRPRPSAPATQVSEAEEALSDAERGEGCAGTSLRVIQVPLLPIGAVGAAYISSPAGSSTGSNNWRI